MIVKTSLGKDAVRTLRTNSCMMLGRRLANMECGLGVAARGVQSGGTVGASNLVQGLRLASRFAKDVGDLFPEKARAAWDIKKAAEKIDAEVMAKKKISSPEAAKILVRIVALHDKTKALVAAATRHCGGK